jgi:hypothetical protein
VWKGKSDSSPVTLSAACTNVYSEYWRWKSGVEHTLGSPHCSRVQARFGEKCWLPERYSAGIHLGAQAIQRNRESSGDI